MHLEISQQKLETFISKDEKFESFVKVDVVRDLESIMKKVEGYGVECTDMPYRPLEFLQKYSDFEKEHERGFDNSNYKARHGIHLIALLPLNINSEALRKLVKMYVDSIRGAEINLKYVSWCEYQGIAKYLHIFICDREWNLSRRIYYTRNYYQNSVTKGWCKVTDPNAVLVSKKGDLKEIVHSTFSPTKTRLFVYVDDAEAFLKSFVTLWEQAILSLDLVKETKFKFSRNKIYAMTNQYLRRTYMALNRLQIYVENYLNVLWNICEKQYVDLYDVYRSGASRDERISNSIEEKLNDIFHHYRMRFSLKRYHIDEDKFSMEGRVDLAEANIELLKALFDKEIKEFISNLNINEVVFA